MLEVWVGAFLRIATDETDETLIFPIHVMTPPKAFLIPPWKPRAATGLCTRLVPEFEPFVGLRRCSPLMLASFPLRVCLQPLNGSTCLPKQGIFLL